MFYRKFIYYACQIGQSSDEQDSSNLREVPPHLEGDSVPKLTGHNIKELREVEVRVNMSAPVGDPDLQVKYPWKYKYLSFNQEKWHQQDLNQ